MKPKSSKVLRAAAYQYAGLFLGLFWSSLDAGGYTVRETSEGWQLKNSELQVSVLPGPGRITVKQHGLEWSQAAGSSAPNSVPLFRSIRQVQQPIHGLKFETPAGPGGTNLMLVLLSLSERGPDLFFQIDLPGRQAKIQNLFPVQPFLLDSTNAGLVVADYCDGHLYPLNGKPPRTWFNLWSIDMPWVGVCDLASGRGYALVVETDDDACIRIVDANRSGCPLWLPQAGFQESQGEFRYPRKFFYHFSERGGYVGLAKRFRQYAREQGLLVTFGEKLKTNPNVRRLFGAPDVWGDASLAFATQAKAAGVAKMIIHGRAPAEEMRQINDLGYLTSEYDNYTDIFQVEPGKQVDAHHGQLPEDVVLKADGQRMTAWLTWDKKQYMKRCPSLWVPAAKIVVPHVLQQRPFLGRFIDVTTAEELYECRDPNHPLTRSAKRQCGVDLLGYVRSLGLVTGGEHGRYWAVPHLDYIEGMQSGGSYSWPAGWLLRPKSKEQVFDNPWGGKFGRWAEYEQWGIGHAARVPLWELVFHDCIISTWYWGDASDFLLQAAPEVTAKKDAFNILYGTIPLMWANKEGGWNTAREVFLRTYRNTCKLHEAIAGTEMLSHEFLTADRAVQRSRFSDGTEVVVNFGPEARQVKLRRQTYLLPQNGFAVKGPRIQQSLALVNGKTVTSIQAGGFRFTE